MRNFIVITAVIFLTGCAEIQSKETFVACRVADVATTAAIIHSGGVELDPIMKHVLAIGWPAFGGVELAVIWFAWKYWDMLTPPQKVVINVVGCSPIPGNVQVLKAMR